MLNDMPHKIIKFHSDLSNNNLNDLFGFFKVEITTPKNLIYPLLPFKNENLTIHPSGKFTGIYFSEELKAVQAQGYKIVLLEGYEFSRKKLFENYINEFYKNKKISKGAERYIAKLHLNTLYGYFGRSLDLLETLIVKNNSLNLNHVKWFRSLENANIILKNQEYLLTPTQNKRKLIYKGGVAIDTNPFNIN
jgi:DNA polymerase type B, organellar and viral